jgi:hypothetical protein
MSHPPSDKYIYFTVGILKESTALEALTQDALKYHMIDQPGHLIALRLTEYYEMMNPGIVQPVVRVPAVMTSVAEAEVKEEKIPVPPQPATTSSDSMPPPTPISSAQVTNLHQLQPQSATSSHPALISHGTGKMRALRRENDSFIAASPTVDQNADEAADYWSIL